MPGADDGGAQPGTDRGDGQGRGIRARLIPQVHQRGVTGRASRRQPVRRDLDKQLTGRQPGTARGRRVGAGERRPAAQRQGRIADDVGLLAGRADENAGKAGPDCRDGGPARRAEIDQRGTCRAGPFRAGRIGGNREHGSSPGRQPVQCTHHGPEHGTIYFVPVVLIGVAVVIVVGVIIVALGRGGELAQATADFVPFEIEDVTATDVALLRPPPSLYGYNIPATDQALSRIAQTMTERDVEIATLRQQVAELRSIVDATAAGGRTVPAEPASPGSMSTPGSTAMPGTAMPGSMSMPSSTAMPGSTAVPGRGMPGSTATPGTATPGTAMPGSTATPGTATPGTAMPGSTAMPGTATPGTAMPGSTATPGTAMPGPAGRRTGAPGGHAVPGQAPPPLATGPAARPRTPLPARPSAWRRERADPPAAPDPWPPRVPWSAWERPVGTATGPGEAAAAPGPLPGDGGDPAAAPQPAEPDPVADAASEPVADTDPGVPGEAW
jgi:hypothetical protein